MESLDLSSHNLANHYNNVYWIDGVPWYARDRILSPLSMPHKKITVNPGKIRKALNDSKALMARWYDEWNREESECWWTCCDNHEYDFDNIKNSRGRRGIRKGLRECDVRLVEPRNFVKISYQLYKKSLKSYGYKKFQIPSKKEFSDRILRLAKYSGTEIWGAFVGDELASYAVCKIIDNAVRVDQSKSDSDLHKYCPNNALFFSLTRHYLQERDVLYVSNGSRTLLHTTSINEFLRRMGYRKIYCRINIELAKILKLLLLLRVDLWGKTLHDMRIMPSSQWMKIQSLIKLVKMSRPERHFV